MKKIFKLVTFLLAISLILFGCGQKQTQQDSSKEEKKLDFGGRTMNVVATSEKYKKLFDKFAEETNSKVEFLSMSSGEVISRIKAEGGKPMADLWFGGGIDAFIAAKNDGLLEQYEAKGSEKIKEGFKDKDNYWISKGITVVGFLVNDSVAKEKGYEIPKKWEDLVDPKYKGQIIMSNPAISGSNYGAVKGILDQKGAEKGWEYWTDFNKNVDFYSKRGKDPQEKTVAGEFGIGIIPVDKSAFDAAKKNNLTVVYPEDGIPWIPEGVAIFKNSNATDIAKAFEDFILKPENQQLIAELDGKDGAQMVIDGAKGAELGLPKDKLIKEDLATFGSERESILKKWKELVGEK
ncbi:ABC transporter substrate-binding protein [Gemella cuniculi]|uniref:ABC transporter substrate-binding protein n=1 Tax=Gemella cuniculi TaxID=150240 RepID=UPI0004139E5D|nr:ABC transporter substrate-binding protein [Gemella cuniculi]